MCPKCLIAVVLVDVDLPYWTLKVEHIVAFIAIFRNICTAHVQKLLFMNFRCIFRHRCSIRRPRFPVRVQNFGDLASFSTDFCILYAECPPYFYFQLVWPTDLESIPHASTLTSIISTKFEVDMTIHCRVIAFLSEQSWSKEGTVRHRQSKEASILWSHYEETRELPGERDNAWNNARWTHARKAMHGLDGQHQDVDRTLCGRVNQNDRGQR